MKTTAIIAAAGMGSRMKAGKNKVLLNLCGRSVLEHTVSVFERCDRIDDIVIVAGKDDISVLSPLFSDCAKPIRIIQGADTRQGSVYNGISAATGSDFVCIHDAARALITSDIICDTLDNAVKFGAAAPGMACSDSLKKSDENGFISETVDRAAIFMIQTPQIFRRCDILRAHVKSIEDNFSATDDCALYEKYIGKVKITPGSRENIKLTVPEDMRLAEVILKMRNA